MLLRDLTAHAEACGLDTGEKRPIQVDSIEDVLAARVTNNQNIGGVFPVEKPKFFLLK
jgi:hypothetical protein